MEIYEKHTAVLADIGENFAKSWAWLEEESANASDVLHTADEFVHRHLEDCLLKAEQYVVFCRLFRDCLNAGPGCNHSEEDHDHMLWAFDNPEELRRLAQNFSQ